MTAYLNSVIATVIVCRIAVMFAPESEMAKKYVRLICALVVLLTLLSPVKSLIENADGIISSVTDFLTGEVSVSDSDIYGSDEQNTVRQLAYAVMLAVEAEFGVDSDDIGITVVIDESGEVSELQLYLAHTAYSDRAKIGDALEGELQIPIYVFPER